MPAETIERMDEPLPPLAPIDSSLSPDMCRKCSALAFHSVVLAHAQVGSEGPAVVGRWVGCTSCGYSPHPPIGTRKEPAAPNRVLGWAALLLLLAAPGLWAAAIWTGDGRFGAMSLPVLFVALVVFVAAFSVGSKGGRQ